MSNTNLYKIYKIYSISPMDDVHKDRVYIGVTKQTLKERFKQHKTPSSRSKAVCLVDRNIDNWRIELVDICHPSQDPKQVEKWYIMNTPNVTNSEGKIYKNRYNKKSNCLGNYII